MAWQTFIPTIKMASPSASSEKQPTFTARGLLAAAIDQIEGRRINGEEADDFFDEIQSFEHMTDELRSEDRNLLKKAHEQLKLHGFRVRNGRLQYNLWKDTLLPKPERNKNGSLTPQAVVAWYDAFVDGKEMDIDTAWLFTAWSVDEFVKDSCPRYLELWSEAYKVLGWDEHEDDCNYEQDDGGGYSHREEVGVNGGSSCW